MILSTKELPQCHNIIPIETSTELSYHRWALKFNFLISNAMNMTYYTIFPI